MADPIEDEIQQEIKGHKILLSSYSDLSPILLNTRS